MKVPHQWCSVGIDGCKGDDVNGLLRLMGMQPMSVWLMSMWPRSMQPMGMWLMSMQPRSMQLMELLFSVGHGCGVHSCVDGIGCGMVGVGCMCLQLQCVVSCQPQVWWQWPCAYCSRSGSADLQFSRKQGPPRWTLNFYIGEGVDMLM